MPLICPEFRVATAYKKAAISILTVLCLSACGRDTPEEVFEIPAQPLLAELAPAAGIDAAAQFIAPDGTVVGNTVLKDGPNGVLIRVDLKDLTTGWHGIHLHQVADCSDGDNGFKASGSHIDPDNNAHGLFNAEGYERADIPNLYAGDDGRATAAFFNSYVRLLPGEEAAASVGPGAILMDEDGFAIIIHAAADDHMSQPIGGAGSRVACAALGG